MRRSVMTHTFSEVPQAEIPRSTFNRSHGHKTTVDAGFIYPLYVDEALPGDTARVNMTMFARLATPIFPFMDNMVADVHFFSVPVRLIWDNWERFNGAQDNPGDSTDYYVPYIQAPAGGVLPLSISDYMGIPPGVAGFSFNSLWHRAYNLVFNSWYRDENLVDSRPVPKGDGPDNLSDFALMRRGKRHDYFTSALPWPQKGPGVSIPLGTQAPVRGIGLGNQVFGQANQTVYGTAGAEVFPFAKGIDWASGANGSMYVQGTAAAGGTPIIYADLSSATAATINSLRQAFQIQKMYERDARGGTRYVEIVKSHWGVTMPDFRAQRPEFLGGGSCPVNISPVPQTSASGAYADSPQGNLAAFGTATMRSAGFTASFTEHCVILGLVSFRADLTYQQGINRMFLRRTRFDFYWPALAHIGEQAIYNAEIYLAGIDAQDRAPFGYQERFAEYRYKPSLITGEFRSSFAQSLDAWHLSQDFAALPLLNQSFIEEDPPVDRVIAVATEPHFLVDTFFQMNWARPMPVYGVPGLIDHF